MYDWCMCGAEGFCCVLFVCAGYGTIIVCVHAVCIVVMGWQPALRNLLYQCILLVKKWTPRVFCDYHWEMDTTCVLWLSLWYGHHVCSVIIIETWKPHVSCDFSLWYGHHGCSLIVIVIWIPLVFCDYHWDSMDITYVLWLSLRNGHHVCPVITIVKWISNVSCDYLEKWTPRVAFDHHCDMDTTCVLWLSLWYGHCVCPVINILRYTLHVYQYIFNIKKISAEVHH